MGQAVGGPPRSLTDRDILTRCLASGYAGDLTPMGVLMTSRPVTTTPTASAEEAAHVMAEHGVRRLPVVDRGRAVGMLGADDIARACGNEVIGEMARRVAAAPRRGGDYALAMHVEYMDG